MALLRVDSLTLVRQGRRILDGVSLEIGRAEWLSIIGPNGAGKTSLLRCLMRLERPDSGAVSLAGAELKTHTQRQLCRLLGYVPQGIEPAFPYTVLDFLVMCRYSHLGFWGKLEAADTRAIQGAIDTCAIKELSHRPVTALSGGERQKVMIAAALVAEPRALLLDEPTTFLDPRHQAEIHKALLFLKRDRQKAIIVVTHDINVGLFSADKLVALKEGKVVFCGAPAELTTATLQYIYDHPFSFVTHPGRQLPFFFAE